LLATFVATVFVPLFFVLVARRRKAVDATGSVTPAIEEHS
jgi:hypothetical protein